MKLKMPKDRELIVALGALAITTLVVAGVLFASLFPEQEVSEITPAPTAVAAEVPRHPLTGDKLEVALETFPTVFGVMVENSADAWPLVGLDQAFLVIEAPVEGGIPRFISFFGDDQEVSKIGPVRSARPYYLDWNDELDGVYAHVGGSPEALGLIAASNETIDLNQFWNGDYFYRQNSTRYAPHNVYTSSTLLAEALETLKTKGDLVQDIDYDAWKFRDNTEAVEKPLSLKIDFSSGTTYDVDWKFDTELNAYVRYQAGSKFLMEDKAPIVADNVAVIATDIRVVDSTGRRHIVTVGEGNALIMRSGELTLGKWNKDSRTSRLRFFDENNTEIEMNAGKTWIEVVEALSATQTY